MIRKIAIVGAGLTGLTAGYELSRKGYKVTIFEKNSDIGGLMGGFKIGDTSLEKTYHHIFKTDKQIIDLIKELGLHNKLRWYPEKTSLYFDGKMYPFMGIIDLLKFKPLGVLDKIRLGLVKIWLENDNDWKKYESVTAVDWMRKWCGKNAYRIIWKPLLKGKFDEKFKDVSMAWLWARIHTRGNSGQLGYMKDGFQQVADTLATKIKDSGGEIIINTEVDREKIKKDFDRVIDTGAINNIDYLGAICVVFTSKQSLSSYYWHNINDIKSPFVAFIQHTNLVDKSNYDGKNVYYLGKYLPNDQLKEKDEDIKKRYFDHLKKIYPEFKENLVEKSWVFKLKNAQHIVNINYKVPSYKIDEKVYHANFAQIYPEDRGINFAVREGVKIAKMTDQQI